MDETHKIIDGKYELKKLIGKGGMSSVYLAEDKRLKKLWAVKALDESSYSGGSLPEEVRLLKRLSHPAFPRIVDIIKEDKKIYIVMDYIEGRPLDMVLKEEGPLSARAVRELALQICGAIGYLHRQKPPVIYRDLKPSNLILSPDGNVRIIDLGIAQEKTEIGNRAGSFGTKGFAAPEQYKGFSDERSDIYALGMTMYALLKGNGLGHGKMKNKDDEDLLRGLLMIIEKCTRKDPSKRYQSCTCLEENLKEPARLLSRHKKGLKKRLLSFAACAFFALSFFLSGLILGELSDKAYAAEYESLISQINSPESYIRAIEIYPYDLCAYIKLLESYEESGCFGPEESAQILYLYNKNKDGFDTSCADYALLNYKTALMYFNCYTDEDGNSSVSERVNKAWPFLLLNHENEELKEEFDESFLCESYYRICLFYREFIFDSSGMEEAKKADFEEILEVMKTVLGEISDEDVYEKLSMCSVSFMLIYDQRKAMAQAEVDEDDLLDLFDEIYETALSLTAARQQSAQLKEEIEENYEQYKKAIEITYENTRKLS